MIYTVTLNPSIDYIVHLDSLKQELQTVPPVKNTITAEKVSMYLVFLQSSK